MSKKKTPRLVRYVSPFGSPAWMSRERAEKHLAEDDKRWLDYQEAGGLGERERKIGPPRIEFRDDGGTVHIRPGGCGR